jgi:hypothetical protein
MSEPIQEKNKCGICGISGKEKKLIGPYCGGPFSWYCADCKKIIDKYNEGVKTHQKLWHKAVAERKQLERKKRC